MNKERLAYLYSQYQSGTLTDEEDVEWQVLINEPKLNEDLKELVGREWYDYNKEELVKMNHVKADSLVHYIISQPQEKSERRKLWPRIAIAASIALAVTIGGYLYLNNQGSKGGHTVTYAADVTPGKQGATLTLANGKKIRLSDAANGEIAKEAGIRVTKTADGQVVYSVLSLQDGMKGRSYNTLTTAKGETYQVRLPDGSLVYLNAASSLTYSAALIEQGKRMVKLQGEGYFEIAKDKAHPFIVKTDQQQVEVLGTHFNINAYSNEPATKTTLFEGMVKVNNDVVLKPGEQSILTGNKQISIVPADFDDVLAWKTGVFKFDNDENITSIMREVERWYDVEVVYVGDMKEVNFTGTISRFKNISSLLEKMEQTGMVKFKIAGRKVTAIKL